MSKISPLAGAKRLFSSESLVNFVKGLFKIGIVGVVMIATVWSERDRLDPMMTVDPLVILTIFKKIGTKIFMSTLMIVTLIAFADYLYVCQKWWKKQMMTLQEIKDEYKQMEGDPHVRGRLRQLRHDKACQRMMAAVSDTMVVITNPTHFAVALKYDREMSALQCVAKGADAMVKKHDVPIVKNPPLARALFASMEINNTAPNEHFKAVVEVIGFVMRLKKRRAGSRAKVTSGGRTGKTRS
ncbi:MAG: EscU/YscU/HrcU family type III secretion system export apparatus switch protein [Candidatus Devosia symbiotica]|nr:EscU/YscU/HrcU family type III secretion system export apparatus switch protein [Candidatus Devosia symbiotica]